MRFIKQLDSSCFSRLRSCFTCVPHTGLCVLSMHFTRSWNSSRFSRLHSCFTCTAHRPLCLVNAFLKKAAPVSAGCAAASPAPHTGFCVLSMCFTTRIWNSSGFRGFWSSRLRSCHTCKSYCLLIGAQLSVPQEQQNTPFLLLASSVRQV